MAKREAEDKLFQLRRDEESKWAQRAKVKYIQEGGSNTRYFHIIANGKHKKKKILQLEQEEGTIVGQENLKTYISEYYKQLFGAPVSKNFALDENRVHDMPQISQEENEILTQNFSAKEVFEAIQQMEHNKAPGQNGFPAEFYQSFWEIIKTDLMVMFVQLRAGNMPLFKINFGIITLLPKKEDASKIEQYRPI